MEGDLNEMEVSWAIPSRQMAETQKHLRSVRGQLKVSGRPMGELAGPLACPGLRLTPGFPVDSLATGWCWWQDPPRQLALVAAGASCRSWRRWWPWSRQSGPASCRTQELLDASDRVRFFTPRWVHVLLRVPLGGFQALWNGVSCSSETGGPRPTLLA